MPEIPARPAAAPTTGLVVSAVATARVADPGGWTRGDMQWRPERCGDPYTGFGTCQMPPAGVDDLVDAPEFGSYEPLTWRVAQRCSTMTAGGNLPSTDRVVRSLAATIPYAVARELWTGAYGLADRPYDPDVDPADTRTNLALRSPSYDWAPITLLNANTAPVRARVALGMLMQALGDCTRGQRGMVHMPLLAEPSAQGVYRQGNLLLARANDTVIVADAGYPAGAGNQPADVADTAPPAGVVWWYGTGLVEYRETPDAIPGADLAAQVDWRNNDRIIIGERTTAATFDPCCRFAVAVSLTADE